jgi:hypothetical protein
LTNAQGSAVIQGQAVASNGVGGQFQLATNNGTFQQASVIGLVYDASIANNAAGNIVVNGGVLVTSGLTAGAQYYLGTGGALTTTAPTTAGQYVVPVGIAISTTQLLVQIAPPVLL